MYQSIFLYSTLLTSIEKVHNDHYHHIIYQLQGLDGEKPDQGHEMAQG